MLNTSNTHANIFHIINHLQLPVFLGESKAIVDDLLIPEGCVDYGSNSLPIRCMGLDRMSLMVPFHMEALISDNMTKLPP